MTAALTSLPLLAVGSDDGLAGCVVGADAVDDGTPTILGPSTLTVTDVTNWWAGTGRGQPARLAAPIGDVIALYLSEGDAEGVRGDLAFAQAVLETSSFSNSGTAMNNFAGIAHYDNARSGTAFPNALTGVRAHIQLLKKFAAGNGVATARPDVSPNAGARSTTWGGLTGVWASSPSYWPSINAVYQSMVAVAGPTDDRPLPSPLSGLCMPGLLATSGDYALPLERRWYDEHPEWFTKTHHDYPAADIPVPTGTFLYAVTTGVVVSTPASGRCGVGVVLNGDDGAQYTYCHGLPGSQAVATGERVRSGELLMSSASTGNSTGPHLHFGIRVNGQNRCPQPFFVAIVEGQPLDPHGLPASGCTH